MKVSDMKKLAIALRLTLIAAAAFSVVYLAGCETTDEWDTSLTVSPSSVTSQTYPESVTLTVGGATIPTGTNTTAEVMNATLGTLSLPLTWSVSRPTLGTIASASGNQAIYLRTRATGINIITVRDQTGAEGMATVNQQAQTVTAGTGTLNLSASPNPIPNGQNQSVLTVVSGGTSPYTWAVLAPASGTSANGSIVTAGNTGTETYQSANAGANLIRVTDSTGRIGTITITQQ
jgi:hypothetical protein